MSLRDIMKQRPIHLIPDIFDVAANNVDILLERYIMENCLCMFGEAST